MLGSFVAGEQNRQCCNNLKFLKRFWELEDGFKKLLSILLIGQPELKNKLDERQHYEAREVIRCAAEGGAYSQAIDATSRALADPIDSFFDKDRGVFVMADDLAVRENRLRMLATIAGALRRVARLELLDAGEQKGEEK